MKRSRFCSLFLPGIYFNAVLFNWEHTFFIIYSSLCFVYSGLLINAMLATFRSSYIAKHALQFFELISACSDEGLFCFYLELSV